MRFMVLVKANAESEAGVDADRPSSSPRWASSTGAGQGRRHARGRGPPAELARAPASRFEGGRKARWSTARSPRPRSWSPASGSSQVESREEAVEWVRRAPVRRGRARDRDPPGLRGRGLRRRVHARAARAARRRLRETLEEQSARGDDAATAHRAYRAIDAVWRIESARLIAGLARIVRDVGLAEDLAQDALVAALEQWPESGIPDNPGAWLMATAKHRAIDLMRRDADLQRKHEEIGRDAGGRSRRTAARPRGRDRRRHRRRPAAA